MTRLLLPLAIALLAAVPAAAQAPTYGLTFSPNTTGKPTSGTLTARDLPPEPDGAAPVDVLALALQKGFVTDAKGAPARCNSADTSEMRCPETARIGSGQAVLEVSYLGGRQDYTATLQLFVVSSTRVALQIDEPQTGTRASVNGQLLPNGRLGGPELRFEGLSKAVPEPPPGFTARLKSFEMTVGRKRTVTRRVRTRSGKRRKVRRTYTVVRTPKTCAGAWNATLVIARTDGSETAQALSAPCAP